MEIVNTVCGKDNWFQFVMSFQSCHLTQMFHQLVTFLLFTFCWIFYCPAGHYLLLRIIFFYKFLCSRAISSLETAVDRLSHQFDKIMANQVSRPVWHSASTLSITEATALASDITEKQRSPVSPRVRTSSHLFSLSSVPSVTPSSESWRMPFMFKCLGTLRYVYKTILSLSAFIVKNSSL